MTRRKLVIMGSFFFLLFLGGLIASRFGNAGCSKMAAPTIPVYPGSILLAERKIHASPDMAVYYYTYEIVESPEIVTGFYRTTADYCDTEIVDATIICNGRSEPYGRYHVYINYSPTEYTAFAIEIDWIRGCGAEWVQEME